MKRVLLTLAVLGVLAAWPAGAGAATLKGVVVGKLHGRVLVASPAGILQSVAGSASVGSRVAVAGGRLVVVGRAHTARIRGIVVRRIGTVMFVSSNRQVVALHAARRLASASDSTPTTTTTTTTTTTPAAPGTVISAQVGIGANGQLDEETEDDVGTTSASSLQIQAVVASVGAGTVTLTVNGQSLTLPLPAGLTLPASIVGQTVTLSVDLNESNDDNNDSNDDGDSGDSGGGGGD